MGSPIAPLMADVCMNWILNKSENIYKQTDGILMGSPIAPLMADVCMNWILNKSKDSNHNLMCYFVMLMIFSGRR